MNVFGYEFGYVFGFWYEYICLEVGICFEDNNWCLLMLYDLLLIMYYL